MAGGKPRVIGRAGGSVRALAHALGARVGRRALVLLYHRVAEPRADPWSLAVPPRLFAEQLEVLRRRVPIVPLHALPGVLEGRRAPRRVAAITFDDGYADNFYAAAPALARYDAPATIFVAGASLGQATFWWDRLEWLVLRARVLPPVLRLEVGGRARHWAVGPDAAGSAPDGSAPDGSAPDAGHQSSRHTLFLELWRLLQPADGSTRERLLAALAAQIAPAAPAAAAPPRPMTAAEVVALAARAPIEVGAHTLTHPRLAELPPAEQRREIVGSRQLLRELTGTPVESFSYPFGGPDDFGPAAVELVRAAGFRRACANVGGTVAAHTDPFRWPRMYVLAEGGEQFDRRLAAWLAAPAG